MSNRTRILASWLLCLTATSLLAADQPRQTIPEPGFRPDDYCNPAFAENLDTATIAVLPTIIRRADRTAHSFDSQQQIVAFLNEMALTATSKPRRVDLGPMRRRSQWEIFQYGARSVKEALEGYDTGTDYTLVMEILVPKPQAVFGIEIYMLDKHREFALSFLLNDHHQMFADANLVAKGSSEEARTAMIAKATNVGLKALDKQLQQLRDCAANRPAEIALTEAGRLQDFESGLPAGTDKFDIPLGFTTFSDGASTVQISTTDSYPVRPGDDDGNSVLQLDADIKGWGGFVNTFTDASMETWSAQDWSALDGISFWLYGNNSGAQMFVHIFDNRHLCSTRDDAERYGIEFWDDVAGWRLIRVPFEDMARKDVGNGAPNDGLNLTAVHGWGVGLTESKGSRTFYIDDFSVWRTPRDASIDKPEVVSHRLFEETRLSDNSSVIMLRTGDMRGPVAEKAMDLMCECARLTRDKGFRYYLTDDRAALSGGRHRFRLTFFNTVPEGIATADATDFEAEKVDVMTAAVDTATMTEICGIQ